MESNLLIVDMQDGFSTASQVASVVDECVNKIRSFKQRQLPIISLEFRGYGPLLKKLRDAVGDYERFYRTTKGTDDGAYEVDTLIKSHGLSDTIFTCGVNAGYCVRDTVETLRDSHYHVFVIQDGISCWYHDEVADILRRYNTWKQIV